MRSETRGLYKDGNDAQITDGHNEIPIPRERYENNGYLPFFDDLPAREEYEASNKHKL